ncbi:dehydrogenase/reductase SDR family member 4 [Halyomorpha halys]|uniref:dehydrogenase/reductase SDR family member 4 n=1 Tax=Halyomorpha halys TaxID=286706 RepID=UPI0006D4ECA1|nr:dehydrogenase/reductase SDR family member 4 [Halyomorpha halys]
MSAVKLLRCSGQALTARTMSSGIRRLQDKVAIVTASTDGIGFAIAKRLAEEGANVVISSRKEKNVQNALNELHNAGLEKAFGITCHVAKKEDRECLFKLVEDKFGHLDILVSNAAVNPAVGDVFDCPEDVWDKIFEVNVKCAFMLSKEALPLMKKAGRGSIVYVSSIAGFQPISLLGAYSVSKTALLGLTKAGAVDLAKENIRVNCVAPGVIQTKFASALTDTEDVKETILQNIPMRRIGKPNEIAGAVAFLCSDDASYLTGETIIIAGGTPSRL